MGVDYKFSGSASYPRFNEELESIAVQVFGATVTQEFKDALKKPENNTITGYFFAKAHEIPNKYVWPENTPDVVKTFFNNPREFYDPDIVKELWKYVEPHSQKIEELSWQFLDELKNCAFYDESWSLS